MHEIARVLARYPASVRPTGPVEPLGNAGGLSGASLWRFPTVRGPRLLRLWPEGAPDAAAIRRVHGWLDRLSGLDFIARPEPLPDGGTLLGVSGRLWQVEPFLPGAAVLVAPPSPEQLRAAFRAIGECHSRLSAGRMKGESPGLRRRVEDLDRLVAGGIDDLAKRLAQTGASTEQELARHWLDLARPLARPLAERLRRDASRPLPLQPTFRDLRPDHLLFEDERLTGLIDYGAMGVECPAADLSRLLPDWIGPDPLARAEALASYVEAWPSGRDVTAFIEPFERSADLLTGLVWVHWAFVEGRRFERPDAVSRGLASAVDRLARLAMAMRPGVWVR